VFYLRILEKDFIEISEKAYYGAFKSIPAVGKVGIGYAMAMHDSNSKIKFSLRTQGSNVLQRIALDAMQYDKNDRPSAAEIHDRVTNVEKSVRLHEPGNKEEPAATGYLTRTFWWMLRVIYILCVSRSMFLYCLLIGAYKKKSNCIT